MNSKNLVLTLAVAASAIAFADEYDEDGGYLVQWPKDHGTFFFVDARKKPGDEPVKNAIARLSGQFSCDFRTVTGEAPDFRAVPEALGKLGAKGAIWIVDDPALPVSLAATESGWGFFNVAPIVTASKGDEKLVAKRTLRCLSRLFGEMHGASEPMMMPACVMKQAVGFEGIDKLPCDNFSPTVFSNIDRCMRTMGYKFARRGTYYEACLEGWAPSPTNAVQRKIWDEIHQMPTKPIKILPPSKQKK